MDDAGGLLGGAAPGDAFGGGKRDAQSVAGRVDAIGDEAETIRSDIDGHSLFEPRDALGTHANGDGERAAVGRRSRNGGSFGCRLATVGRIRRSRQGTFEMNGDGDALLSFSFFATENAREDFGLAVGLRGIEGKSDPKRHADSVMFLAGEEQAATRSIAGFTLLDFLAEGRSPAEPYRKAEVNSAIKASRHGITRRAVWLG